MEIRKFLHIMLGTTAHVVGPEVRSLDIRLNSVFLEDLILGKLHLS